jgi:hypothetical protein
MAPALDPELAAEMRARADAIRERQASGNFTKSWPLSGKKAIVEAGKSVVVRLLPRWDISQSTIAGPVVDGKPTRVANPQYKKRLAFVDALEHWWESADGKTTREYCPRSVGGPQAPCAVCFAADALLQSASKDDREYGKRIKARPITIFNAVVGNPRKLGDDNLVDIRIISCSDTQYRCISDIMTGGDNAQFARGDVTDARAGYDLLFNRPVGGGGERWTVKEAPEPSPLYTGAQAAAFKGWAARPVDLDKMLKDETKDSVGMFKAYYGRDPGPEDAALVTGTRGGRLPEPPQTQEQEPETAGAETESAAEPEAPDDEYMPQTVAPKATATAAPRATPPRGRR